MCNKIYPSRVLFKFKEKNEVPHCDCGKILNVDVVLFGDSVRQYHDALSYINVCDLVIVMGTGLEVYPFNNLLTNNRKRKNILLNYTDISKKRFEVKLLQDIGKSVTGIIDNLNERI